MSKATPIDLKQKYDGRPTATGVTYGIDGQQLARVVIAMRETAEAPSVQWNDDAEVMARQVIRDLRNALAEFAEDLARLAGYAIFEDFEADAAFFERSRELDEIRREKPKDGPSIGSGENSRQRAAQGVSGGTTEDAAGPS